MLCFALMKRFMASLVARCGWKNPIEKCNEFGVETKGFLWFLRLYSMGGFLPTLTGLSGRRKSSWLPARPQTVTGNQEGKRSCR